VKSYVSIHLSYYIQPVSTKGLLNGNIDPDELLRLAINAMGIDGVMRCHRRESATSLQTEIQTMASTLRRDAEQAFTLAVRNEHVPAELLRNLALMYMQVITMVMTMSESENPGLPVLIAEVAYHSEAVR
jgi:hypothetical protein